MIPHRNRGAKSFQSLDAPRPRTYHANPKPNPSLTLPRPLGATEDRAWERSLFNFAHCASSLLVFPCPGGCLWGVSVRERASQCVLVCVLRPCVCVCVCVCAAVLVQCA